MNFYPVPPVIKAELYASVPDELRVKEESEWRGGFAGTFEGVFLEGPTPDAHGNLYITDIPGGQILKVNSTRQVERCIKYDGEPNGMVIRKDGKFVVADYKQVSPFTF